MLTLIPVLIPAFLGFYAVARGVNCYSALLQGAEDGLRITLRILPPLIVLLPAAAVLRESGAAEALSRALGGVLAALGLPAETVPLMLLRPVSGSAAMGLGAELIARYGPDSLIGRTAAVMLGSTETTFYVIAVYFGAAGIKKTRHAVPAALAADLTGFVMAALSVRLFFS